MTINNIALIHATKVHINREITVDLYKRKGIFTSNIHVKYKKPYPLRFISYDQGQSFKNEGQRSQSRSQGQNFWYCQKGLVARNTVTDHVKYKSPYSSY